VWTLSPGVPIGCRYPQNGVLFACRNSDSRGAPWADGRPDLPGLGTPLLRAAERREAGGAIRGGEIVQKGLDFAWERSVSGSAPVEHQRLFEDPAPPALSLVWGFGGGGARRRFNRTKDFDNVTQKAVIKRAQPRGYKAGSSARDALSETGRNHCDRHEETLTRAMSPYRSSKGSSH